MNTMQSTRMGKRRNVMRIKCDCNRLDACKVMARKAGAYQYSHRVINAFNIYNNKCNTNECNDHTVHNIVESDCDVNLMYYRSTQLLFPIANNSPRVEKFERIEIDPQSYSVPKSTIMPNNSAKRGHKKEKKKNKSEKRVSFADDMVSDETNSHTSEPQVIRSVLPHVLWIGDHTEAHTSDISITDNIDGKVAEAIIAADFNKDGKLGLLVKWVGTDFCDFIAFDAMCEKWPQMVIEYLQQRTKFE